MFVSLKVPASDREAKGLNRESNDKGVTGIIPSAMSRDEVWVGGRIEGTNASSHL